MKRTSELFVLGGAALAAGVAFTARAECQVGVVCVGTGGPDELLGLDNRDEIRGTPAWPFLQWQPVVPESVKVSPAMGTNSHP